MLNRAFGLKLDSVGSAGADLQAPARVVADLSDGLLTSHNIVVEAAEAAGVSVSVYRKGGDFAYALIAEQRAAPVQGRSQPSTGNLPDGST